MTAFGESNRATEEQQHYDESTHEYSQSKDFGPAKGGRAGL